MVRNATFAIVSLLAPGAPPSGAPAPVKVFLESAAEDAVEGVDAARVDAALRKELGGKKSLSLVATPEEAAVVLRVTECLVFTEKRRVNEARERPVNIPTEGRGVAGGTEGVYGTRTETTAQAVLVVRATWPGQFADLQSHDRDRSLKDAADSVADQLDALAKRGLRRSR